MLCSDCQKPIRPVVALDIDGVLANYHMHFLQFAYDWLGQLCGSKELDYFGATDLATHLGIDKRTYRECKLAFRQGGLKRSMPVIAGAYRLVTTLRDRGCEVWFTTTRPYLRLDNIDIDTREWCRRNNLVFDGLLYDEDKYSKLVEAVGQERIVAVLDDEFSNCWAAQCLGLEAIWMRTKYNSKESSLTDLPQVESLMDARHVLLERLDLWVKKTLQCGNV
jgi:hypothetical protein